MMELLHARCAFVGAARSATSYCRSAGIDWTATELATGGLILADVVVAPGNRFAFAKPGVTAAVVEAIDRNGEVVDLVAWPVTEPAVVLTYFGRVGLMGEAYVIGPHRVVRVEC